jgi:hypothetical protein
MPAADHMIEVTSMLVFLDVFSGDKLGGDSFPFKEVDDFVIEMEGKAITVSGDANPAAGGEDSTAKTVVDIVHTYELEKTEFDKKSFQIYVQGYMKRLLAHLKEHDPERAKIFDAEAPAFIKNILANFKDWDFYTGKSMDPDAGLAFLNYREDGITPYVVVLKDSVKQERY